MNHLAGQTSPYLLQHLNNPVDWYPWGEEALAKAKSEGKPIFLSVGYSACHWCHVMERESFENPAVADYLNEHFVSVKVDREERPDLDDLYMGFVQRTTGAGGWPMTVFLTPERLPFHGGTYYPPEDRFGRPGFPRLLEAILVAWNGRREEVEQAAGQYAAMLAPEFPPLSEPRPGDAESEGGTPSVPATAVEAFHTAARRELAAVYDQLWGGFGGAPKFPRAADLRFLMLPGGEDAGGGEAAAQAGPPEHTPWAMASHTLRAMAAGGMYDQLAGGFARYSVDERWLIPHFEKMLYDQGTLLPAYVEAWERGGEARFAEVVRGSCEYLLRERRDPGGAFLASSDADSEGVEGRYFAWTPAELVAVLGEERGRLAAELYGVTEQGSFEHGTSVLVRAKEPEDPALAEEIRIALLSAREQRVAPADDDKILTAWNGLAIEGLAAAGRVFGEAQWTEAARRAALFLCDALRGEDGRWRRSWRAGRAQHRALLEDYAYLCRGLLALFQAGGEERWLQEAQELGTRMLEDFLDERSGIFFDTDGEDASLLHRLASPWDGATPSPNGVALECLAMLHAFTQEPHWRRALLRGAAAVLPMAARQPRAFTGSARALQWAAEEPGVAVVIGTGSPDSLEDWRTALRRPEYREALPVLRATPAPDSALPLFTERAPHSGGATLFLCSGATCAPPDDRPPPTTG